jgi:hypothetical protein
MALYASNRSLAGRRCFIGGSDARIIMGDDEAALLRLWREKRGKVTSSSRPSAGVEPPKPRIQAVRIVDMSGSNAWAEFAGVFARTRAAYLEHEQAKTELTCGKRRTRYRLNVVPTGIRQDNLRARGRRPRVGSLRDRACGLGLVLSHSHYPVFSCRFRNRTPGPPPFSSMNSTPARFRTLAIAASVAMSPAYLPVSMLVIVLRWRRVASARSRTVQFNAARAILTCALVTGMLLCQCHMCWCHNIGSGHEFL